jgi:hypothetical protein
MSQKRENETLENILKRLEQPGLSLYEETRLYEALTKHVNPTTGKRWTIKDIAQHLGKPYAHVRNRWALMMPFRAAVVDERGKIRRRMGLTVEERLALLRGEKSVGKLTRRALGEEDRPETPLQASRSSIPLRDMQRLFDESHEDNVERRRAIAECMGLALTQAVREAQIRKANHHEECQRE